MPGAGPRHRPSRGGQLCFATFVMDDPVPQFVPMPMSGWTAVGSSRLVQAQRAAEGDLAAQGEAGLAGHGRRLAARLHPARPSPSSG
jgi:hypothetical protein